MSLHFVASAAYVKFLPLAYNVSGNGQFTWPNQVGCFHGRIGLIRDLWEFSEPLNTHLYCCCFGNHSKQLLTTIRLNCVHCLMLDRLECFWIIFPPISILLQRGESLLQFVIGKVNVSSWDPFIVYFCFDCSEVSQQVFYTLDRNPNMMCH